MTRNTGLILALMLCACAGENTRQASGDDEAVRDFIAVRGLEEQDKMRSRDQSSWHKITNTFIVYGSRRDNYLVAFVRPCYELDDNSRITPDRRFDLDTIRARFDTIRGCRIEKIYPVSEAEVAELLNLGEAPGSRN